MKTDSVNALYEPPRGWVLNRVKWREHVDSIRAVERDRIINIVLRTLDTEETQRKITGETETGTEQPSVQQI